MATHDRELDSEVRSFLAAHVDDVESLEVLLLFHRKRVPWTIGEVAEELGLEAVLAGDRLVHLCSMRLLSSDNGGERFAWSTERTDLTPIVDKLASAYRANRRRVLDEIAHAGPLKSFSEAFRLRRRKDDDG